MNDYLPSKQIGYTNPGVTTSGPARDAWPIVFVTIGALAIVALVYLPLSGAGFVWVDKIIFHDHAWLREGDGWRKLIFRGFYTWVNYFRPIVIGLFVAEVRLFGASPGAMHLVSLTLHLVNTALVGLLALGWLRPPDAARRAALVSVALLAYGLHPALLEPVAWICCQFELVSTLFMLLGLVLNTRIPRGAARAVAVSTCFFLAACSKESAVSFPLLLLLADWMHFARTEGRGAALRRLVATQGAVYACVLGAGLAYLVVRYWALGHLVLHTTHESFLSLERFQKVCFTYLSYWRIVLWPMTGLGPLHEVDGRRFIELSATSLAADTTAVGIFALGLFFVARRNALGGVILAVTLSLLPVLHLVPVSFDASLYHERYAATAIAMACTYLPSVLMSVSAPPERSRWLTPALAFPCIIWLGISVLNIRVTTPLWGDELKLWRWVSREYPESLTAKDHLLSTYIERDDYASANQLADELVAANAPCPTCMLNAANLALARGDAARASTALERARSSRTLATQQYLVQNLVIAGGQLSELQRDFTGAETAYRGAIDLDPLTPQARMSLALLLARLGRSTEAREQADSALALYAPDEREVRSRIFKHAEAESLQAPSR